MEDVERNRCSRRNGQTDQRTCETNIRVHGVQVHGEEGRVKNEEPIAPTAVFKPTLLFDLQQLSVL